jgi:protein phosphatase PTC1
MKSKINIDKDTNKNNDDEFDEEYTYCKPNTQRTMKRPSISAEINLEKEDKIIEKSNTKMLVKLKGGKSALSVIKFFSDQNCLDFMNDDKDLNTITRSFPTERSSKRNISNKHVCITNAKRKTRNLIKTLKQKVPKESLLEKGVFFDLEPNSKSRDYMEDYINIENSFHKDVKQNHQVYILSDGHSGHKAAEVTVKLLPEVFSKFLLQEKEQGTKENICENAILNSFVHMDEILQKEVDDNSGCTTNLIYLCYEGNKRVVYSGNVGDSRSILLRESGALRLSYDHKAIDKEEQKRVKQEGGVIIRKRLYGTLAVTRSLGDFEMKETISCLSNKPHITRTEILDSDTFLIIASDGVWDVIKDEDVYELVKLTDFKTVDNITNKPIDLSKLLVKKSVQLGSKDNISCIVIKLN